MSARRAAGVSLGLALAAAPPGPLPAQEPAPSTAPAPAAVIAEFAALCASLGDALWGIDPCGPLVLVEPATRSAIASRPPPAGAFTAVEDHWRGTLPTGLPLANTGFDWEEERWAMVLLPLPADRYDRLRLLAHESFHRVQPQLGGQLPERTAEHLETPEGRTWLRLELRALAAALDPLAGAAPARAAAADAMRLRQHRHGLHPGSAAVEAALEHNEGLAEYTGHRYAIAATGEAVGPLLEQLSRTERARSFPRSFAYATGPALGLLLDRYSPGWRRRAAAGASLTSLLREALLRGDSVAAGGEPIGAIGERYGLPEVAAEETTRERERLARAAELRARLVAGPRLVLRQQRLMRSFDPSAIVVLGEEGIVHPAGTFQAEWGELRVERGGALLSRDLFSALAVSAVGVQPGTAAEVAGDGWVLRLEEGWELAPGERPGDLRVKRSGS